MYNKLFLSSVYRIEIHIFIFTYLYQNQCTHSVTIRQINKDSDNVIWTLPSVGGLDIEQFFLLRICHRQMQLSETKKYAYKRMLDNKVHSN